MTKKYLFLLLLIPILNFAQGEANYWYFGMQAGIDFNTSPPTPITDGQLNTHEGCSSIADPDGNLLFYTDGRTVWNKNHQIMDNADYFGGTGLLGDPSSTSSGLIVPHPSDPDLYYVFTVDEPHHDNAAAYPNSGPAEQDGTPSSNYTDIVTHTIPNDDDGYNNGFNYSVVDMSLDGGLGDVVTTQHNLPLITYDENDPEEIKYKCAEKITAVKGTDCNTIWVITHFVDSFYAFKINESGIDTTPVVSEVGPEISIDDYRRAAIGYLKASPDATKLIIAHNTRTYNQIGVEDAEDGGVFLYDFDNATGEVSNNTPLLEAVNAYGVEFSLQSKKAYATVTELGASRIYQWDMEAANIPASLTPLSGVGGQSPGALQLAPNGKIYRAMLGEPKLAVINHPELTGNNAEYSENTNNGAISLSTLSTHGLPPFIQSIFATRVNIIDDSQEEIITDLDLCDGEEYILGNENYPGGTYTWYHNDNLLSSETSATLPIAQDPNEELPYTEHYELKIELQDGSCLYSGIANITYHPYPEVIDTELSDCGIENSNTGIFDLTETEETVTNGEINENPEITIAYYHNLSDAENDNQEITDPENFESSNTPQTIVAKVTNTANDCSSYAEIMLQVNTINDTPVSLHECPAEENGGFQFFNLDKARQEIQSNYPDYSVSFFATAEEAMNEQNTITNETNFENTEAYSQIIYARVENSESCIGIVEIELQVDDNIPIGEDERVLYCLEYRPEKITISSGIPESEEEEYTYLWEPSGETTRTIKTNEITTHSVHVTRKSSGCSAQKNIELYSSNIASFTVEVTDFSTNNTLTVILSEESIGDYEYALDENGVYQDSNVFENLSPGNYTVYVRDKNGCGISEEKIYILGVMKFFTPNEDGKNDRWHLLGKDRADLSDVEVYLFDRFGKLLRVFNGNYIGWDGTYNGANMPSNDYWYRIELEDGRILRGNFTLKR